MNRRWPNPPFFLAVSALLIAASGSTAQTSPAAMGSSCRPWVYSGADHSNAEASDSGCTNRRNLENMLESKDDLERGRLLGPGDLERESLAIKNYREGKVKEPAMGAAPSGALLLPTVKSLENSP